MKNDELVSVIIPVYNAEEFIEDTINNIKIQTYKNWELLLVNDCSTDKSVSIIEKYLNDSRIKLINLSKNSGPANARNLGIENANGRYLCFQDADDIWNNEKIKKQVDFMKEKECAFSFTGYQFVNENLICSGKKVYVPKKLTYKQALKNTTISTITVMFDLKKISKELIKMPDIKNEDSATWWKILRNGYVAYGLNEILSFYRRSNNTRSSNKFESIKNTWNIYRKQENLNIFMTIFYFINYISNATKRRLFERKNINENRSANFNNGKE